MVSNKHSNSRKGLLWFSHGVFLAFAGLPVPAQAQAVQWTRQFAAGTSEAASGVAVDATGVYIVGSTDGVLSSQTSAGSGDAFVRKYDANGNELWTRQFGSDSYDSASYVTTDSTGIYVVGTTGGALPGQVYRGGNDAFVRKYDANGNELWTRQFGSDFEPTNQIPYGVAADATGVYLVGTWGTEVPNQGNDHSFARKYDPSGNELWTRQFASTKSDYAFGVATYQGGVYVAGFTDGALPGQASAGGFDVFLRRYDTYGNELWTRQFGSSATEASGFGMVSVDATGVYVAGYTTGSLLGQSSNGGIDAFVRMYDADGDELWTRQFGSEGDDYASGVSTTSAGVYVAGYTFGALPGQADAGGMDPFVRMYDTDGDELWTRQFGSPSDEAPSCLATDVSTVYVVGQTGGMDSDAFLLKIETEVIPVAIDIRPGFFPNNINLGSGGTVPVAILSSADFDATTVNPTTVILAGATVVLRGKGTPMASVQDVNGDGLSDLVVHVSTASLRLSNSDVLAVLTGRTYDGIPIEGSDSIRIISRTR